MTDGSRIIKVLKLVSGVLALGFWFAGFFLWEYFDFHKPNIPDPGKGRVYPLNTHGSIVYLTQGERSALYGLIAPGATFFLLALVSHLIEAKRR